MVLQKVIFRMQDVPIKRNVFFHVPRLIEREQNCISKGKYAQVRVLKHDVHQKYHNPRRNYF
jgi:hypothetical protein